MSGATQRRCSASQQVSHTHTQGRPVAKVNYPMTPADHFFKKSFTHVETFKKKIFLACLIVFPNLFQRVTTLGVNQMTLFDVKQLIIGTNPQRTRGTLIRGIHSYVRATICTAGH